MKTPLEYLENEALKKALQLLWVNNHQNLKNPAQFVADFFAFLKNQDLQAAAIRKYYENKLRENRLEKIDADFKKDMLVQLIEPDLKNTHTLLDYGCGKLTYLKNIAKNNKKIKKLIGIDPQSKPTLTDLDPRIRFARELKNIPEKSIDLVVIKLVLHHIASDREILKILKNIKKIIRPGGKLIVFEESFPARNYDLAETKAYLDKYDLNLAEEATQSFLRLSEEEKKQFLFLNDWLINLQNRYMPWPMSYKSVKEWAELGEAADFRPYEKIFLGAIEKRKRKQGMSAIIKMQK